MKFKSKVFVTSILFNYFLWLIVTLPVFGVFYFVYIFIFGSLSVALGCFYYCVIFSVMLLIYISKTQSDAQEDFSKQYAELNQKYHEYALENLDLRLENTRDGDLLRSYLSFTNDLQAQIKKIKDSGFLCGTEYESYLHIKPFPFSSSWSTNDSDTQATAESTVNFSSTLNNPQSQESTDVSFSFKRFCKLCGKPLNDNCKCTGCGKQYFYINKSKALKMYAVAITFCFVGVFFLASYHFQNSKQEVQGLENEIKHYSDVSIDLQKEIKDLKIENSQLSNKLFTFNKLKARLSFYEKNAVFVSTTGEKYHKFGCFHMTGRKYLIYNSANAIKLGYTACADCW